MPEKKKKDRDYMYKNEGVSQSPSIRNIIHSLGLSPRRRGGRGRRRLRRSERLKIVAGGGIFVYIERKRTEKKERENADSPRRYASSAAGKW